MKITKSVLNFPIVIYLITMLASALELPKCGTLPTAIGQVFGGQPSSRNYWKWIVTFHQISKDEFFCAGSLVSAKHVISAAHCFWPKNFVENKRKLPHDVIAWLGKYNLTIQNETGSAAYKVQKIINHEDYNHLSDDFDADLSLIVLEKDVDLQQREFVRTICLPVASQMEVTGNGIIVGWGISEKSIEERKKHDSIPNELKLPAVSFETCLDADDGFVSALSNRMFCAGFINENKSSCSGDSGGGFFQYDRDLKGYRLAGIVSSSLIDRHGGVCNVDTYSMFTSVGKFVGWIEAKMDETGVNRFIEVEMECWDENIFPPHTCNHTYTGQFSKNIRLRQSYANATSVTNLWMNFNPSPYIFAEIGINFPNVKILNIDSQSIKFIERNNFKDMVQLEKLDLQYNQIEIIDEETFNDLPNLRILWLSDNKIKQLPSKIFNNLKNLEEIYLHNNKISTLPRDLFANNLKLKQVDTYNPGLTTNNVDFSKVPNVILWNETGLKYYRRGEHFHFNGKKIQ